MRKLISAVCAAACLAFSAVVQASAQEQQPQPTPTNATTPATTTTTTTPQTASNDGRVPFAEQPIALDAAGRAALAARLRVAATTLNGTTEAPIRNVRFVVENRGNVFYTYVSGFITFYDAEGVRCGEGLFKLDALASGEAAETDAPGLRVTCAPTAWRIVAISLLTRTGDAASPLQSPAAPSTPANAQPSAPETKPASP